MMEKINVLSLPEKLVAGGGALMLVSSIFDWWHDSVPGLSYGYDGWGYPAPILSTLAILISIALAGVIAATKLGNVQMPTLPENLTWGKVYAGGAAVVVVLMLLKAFSIMGAASGGFGMGFFIAAIATGAIAYGGYMIYSQERSGVAR